MWDAVSGAKQYTFEGHEAPVYSVCPHYKENIQVEIEFLTPLQRVLFEFVCTIPLIIVVNINICNYLQ